MRVAFPSTIHGLSGELSFHFGHATAFTVVEYNSENREVISVEIIRNEPHQQGGCMRPIRLLMNSNVEEVVVGGIGRRPLQGFQQLGIQVFKGKHMNVKDNLKLHLLKKLAAFSEEGCYSEDGRGQ